MGRTWYVENKWTCKSCSASNLGRHMNCVRCGAKKAKDAEEQMGSPDAEVTDPEMLRQAKAGANWICEYCGGQERNLNGECASCGGPKRTNTGKDIISDATANAAISTSHIPRASSAFEDSLPRMAVVEDGKYDIRPSWSIKSKKIAGLVAILIPSIVLGLYWLLTPKYVTTRVDSIHWKYTTNLRSREIRHAAEWEHPRNKGFYNEDVFNVTCNSKYYGTEDCNPHSCNPHSVSYSCNCTSYSCNCTTSCSNQGNGYSSCSQSCSTCSSCSTCFRTDYDTCYDTCPVYKDWCDYDYYEWPVTKTVSTSGDDHKIYWPVLETDGSSTQRLQKIQEYSVKFVCSDDSFEHRPKSLSDFSRFNVGDEWRLQVGKIRSHNIEDLVKIKAEKE